MECRKRAANPQLNYRSGADVRTQRTAKLLTDMLGIEVSAVGYNCPDYLSTPAASASGINSLWRSRVCEWFYEVVDKADGDLSRDVVYIAVSILDRFVAKELSNTLNHLGDFRHFYQLAALTSLYIAVKVHYRKGSDNAVVAIRREGNRLTMDQLLRMSTTTFKRPEMQDMEKRILTALAWQVCPPTPALFIRCLLALLPQTGIMTQEVKLWVYEQAVFLAELAPCDYYFAGFRASTIAYAAILATVQELLVSNIETHHEQGNCLLYFLREAERTTGLNPDSDDVIAAKNRLEEIYALSSEGANRPCPHSSLESTSEPHIIPSLPRVVSSEQLR